MEQNSGEGGGLLALALALEIVAQVLRFGSSGPPLLINPLTIVTPSADQFRQEYESGASRTALRKFGLNLDIDIAASEDIWSFGGLYGGWLTAPERLRAVSSSPNDTVGGTGAWYIDLEPHTSDFLWLNEAPVRLEMNGVALTALTDESFIRCIRAAVPPLGVGQYANGATTGTNLGDITVTTESGIIVAHIPAGSGSTQQSMFTVPADKALWLQDLHLSVEDQQPGSQRLFFRPYADRVTAPFSPRYQLITQEGISGVIDITYDYKIRFPPKTDIWLNGSAGTNDTSMAAEYFGLLIDLS